MTASVFIFPGTSEGRQLLKDMLRGARMDSVTPDFDFESCDFDDLAADLKKGEGVYEEWLESRDPDDLDASEKAELAEWKRKHAGRRHQEREGGGK